MGLFGFGKKKDMPYSVVHYEGIEGVSTNAFCSFQIKDDVLNIGFGPERNVTLPMQRVLGFEAMSQCDFMMKYKGTNAPNEKNGIKVSYLVIKYMSKDNEEKQIVLWAADNREILYFTELNYKYMRRPEGNVEL